MRRRHAYLPLFALIFAPFSPLSAFATPSPPAQPPTGPGGSNYSHTAIAINGPYWAEGHNRDNDYRYYIYEPAQPAPAAAPVVLFLHGWLAYTPITYMEWTNHIVRKGYIVVWVRYDAGLRPPWTFLDHAMVTWKDALQRLITWQGHVQPARDSQGNIQTAIVGHSAGGYLATLLAARAALPSNGLPQPHAVVPIEPGGFSAIPPENLAAIDPATKMVVVVGEEDTVVCTRTAVAIWNATPQLLDRDFLLVQSDTRGSPAQIANHFFPTTTGKRDTAAVDARDFYVTFKLSVGALNCVFLGTDCQYAFGKGAPEQIDMGTWSDGIPVKPMIWVTDPHSLPTRCRQGASTWGQRTSPDEVHPPGR
ncbi:MAG: alpha/beta fold hydrolase [Candidatus Rokubacteria bacterium]|nr:alpha/beta fold hydrolase [Candidatus Rokubacteria bacterium]